MAKVAHDGPVTTVSRSPFFSDLVLTVGGYLFAVWRETELTQPLIVKSSGEAGLTPAQVTHTRQARGPGELSLHQGDIVFLHRRLAPGWFLAELQGVLGLAPASFIQLVAGGAAPAQARATQPYTARGPGEVRSITSSSHHCTDHLCR